MPAVFRKDIMYYKFCMYGFLKNLNFFEPFLLLFFVEKGFSFLQIGTLYAVQSVSTNVLEIPTGIMADAVGRRRTMIFSMLSYLAAFFVYYFSTTYVLFVFSAICMSFGDAFRTGTHKAMIFEYLRLKGWKDQKVHYYGNTRSWSQMGSAVSALIAGIIVFYSGSYRYVFLASVVPYLFDLVLLLSYPSELDGERMDFSFKKAAVNFRDVISDFMDFFRNRNMMRAIINSSSYSGYFDAVKDYLQPVLKTFALSLPVAMALDSKQRTAVIIAVVFFALNILTSLASKSAGRFHEYFRDIFRPMNVTLIVGLLAGILAGLFSAGGTNSAAIMLFIILYLIHNIRRPLGEAYITDSMKNDILATALSTESQVSTLFTALTAPAIGFFADQFSVGTAISIVSLIYLTAMPLYYAKHRG